MPHNLSLDPAVTCELPADAVATHVSWSDVNGEFLHFVEQTQSCFHRATFTAVVQGTPDRYSLQPWPLFLGPAKRRELADVAVGIDQLVKGVFARFFQGDAARIAAYYRADNREALEAGELIFPLELSAPLVTLLLAAPGGVHAVPSRGDFVDSPDGIQCIEFNAGGGLGGLQVELFSHLYLESPPLAGFCRERGISARQPDVLRALFLHIVQDTRKLRVWQRGDFHLAILVRPHQPEYVATHTPERYTEKLERALAQAGGGEAHVSLCGPGDLTESAAGLHVDGRRVHAILEQHDGSADMRLAFRHFMRGTVNLFTSPVSQLLTDKRNLALLSAHAESTDFTAAERELINAHIPWTRRVESGRTGYRGRPFSVPQDVSDHRERFLLKKATSLGGAHVHFGASTPKAVWDALIARALRERDWIVQECVASRPYCFQRGGTGVARHEVIWGLYVFGRQFGGAFLRMMPVAGQQEVINSHRGAEVGMLFDVDR